MAAAPDKSTNRSTDKRAWTERPPAEGGTVVLLRPRPGRPWRATPHADSTTGTAFGDLSRYERRADDDDDYRHRMIANVAALAVTALLVVSGLWIANTMAEIRKNQDCVLSGKRNCTPVDVPGR